MTAKMAFDYAMRVSQVIPIVASINRDWLRRLALVVAGQQVFGQVAGSLASHVLADSQTVGAMPLHISFEQAATMPTVFMTADMAFNHAMEVPQGESCLIHAAAGNGHVSGTHIDSLFASFHAMASKSCLETF